MKKGEKKTKLQKAANGVWTGVRVLWLILGIAVTVILIAVFVKVGISLKDFFEGLGS